MGIDAGWTQVDKWLMSGLRHRESMRCRCGVDRATAWDEEKASWLEVESQHCYACEQLERWEKDNKDGSRADIPFLVDTTDDDDGTDD